LLRVASISKRLGGRWVLREVEFDCPEGAVACVSGPNGAGKTTLLRIVAGVIEPDGGAVELDGAILSGRHAAARRRLGYVPEAADPPGYLTVEELLALVAALKCARPLDSALRERLGVDALAHQRIERLSLGERRRACLAAALVGNPAALVLDEPSNGLDADGAQTLVDLLRELRAAGTAILLASHDQELIEALADHRYRLAGGRLAT